MSGEIVYNSITCLNEDSGFYVLVATFSQYITSLTRSS